MATTYTITFKYSVDQDAQDDTTAKAQELAALLAHLDAAIRGVVPSGAGMTKATFVSFSRS